MRRAFIAFLIAPMAVVMAGLSGCDQLGIESATGIAARKEAEGKAIGGGCRHAARSLESCYTQNKRADKAAVFAGWREMNDYMRENKIDAMPGLPEPTETKVDPAAEDTGEAKVAKADKAPKDDKLDKADKAEPPTTKRRRGPP
jgi:hypothetical protein